MNRKKPTPRPEPTVAPDSWWVGLSRPDFYAAAEREYAERMWITVTKAKVPERLLNE